ncbi:hypothetical protein QUF80_08495 [Desulfococcaceae bacterium HSG8]|nr:hypothetical protein [Desulfococcaceae bacterium HSG8]
MKRTAFVLALAMVFACAFASPALAGDVTAAYADNTLTLNVPEGIKTLGIEADGCTVVFDKAPGLSNDEDGQWAWIDIPVGSISLPVEGACDSLTVKYGSDGAVKNITLK